MNIQIKALIEKHIEELSEEIVEHPNYDGSYWVDGLTDSIVDAIELIIDQNQKTQEWLRKEGYLDE